MALFLTLLLLADAPEAVKAAELVGHLKAQNKEQALLVLREMAKLDKNHAEAEALVKVIRDRRLEKPPEVMEACFVALKGIGSRKVTRSVLALLDHSRLKKDEVVRIGVCRALEGSADPKGVESIIDLLRDKEDRVIAAAAEAAGAYRYAKESIRKELFERVMGIYVGTWNVKNTVDPAQKVEQRRAERKWEVVEKPMERALQLLSNVTQNSPPEWRHWWNKNKNKRWADLEG
jgi:HEAT repeat protein